MKPPTYSDWSLRRALLVGALLCGLITSAMAQDAPHSALAERMQMDAYLALFRGDEARDEGRMDEAANAYREAAEAYRALKSSHPEHQPSMVAYRLAHADRELAAIAQDQPEAPPPAEVDGEQFEREQINALRTENRYLRQKLLGLEDELELGVEPAPEYVEELVRLSQQNQELSTTIIVLRKQLETGNVDRTALRAAQQEAREMKTVVAQQRSQLADQRKRAEELGALREEVSELRSRNRQLELAIKGAEQEADTIRRLEDQLKVQNSKGRLLRQDRDRLAGDVKSLTEREETLQIRWKRLEASQSESEKALAASLKEAQVFMDRSAQLEEPLAAAQTSLAEVRAELVAANMANADSQAETTEVEAELDALRQRHIGTETEVANLRQQVLEGRNLETRIAEMEAAHRAELAASNQAHAEVLAARTGEVAGERNELADQQAAALTEEARRWEAKLAEEAALHAGVVSNLVAKHAADLNGLKSEMQALKADLKLAMNTPVPVSADAALHAPVPANAEKAGLRIILLEEELKASREAVRLAWEERAGLTAKVAEADELRRRIAALTEERATLHKQLDEGSTGD